MAVQTTRWPASRPLAGLLAALAIAALLQSTLFAIADPSLLGWRSDHGHLFAGGLAHRHHHPWDRAAAADGTPPSSAPGDTVVFTRGDDGAAGSIASALALPDAAIVLLAGAPGAAIAVAVVRVPAGAALRVPSPPPRG